jgi:hypothetical protein
MLPIDLDIGDNKGMNGIGIGTTVGLGTIIGLGIVSPEANTLSYVVTFIFSGFWSGLIFEAYRLAFSWKHPFRR